MTEATDEELANFRNVKVIDRGRKSMTIKQTGEYLVAGELSRRGYITTTFTGNIPDYDILAINEEAKVIPIQVKTTTGSYSFPMSINDFAIRIKHLEDGRQELSLGKMTNPNLIYIMLELKNERHKEDQFFICTKSQIQTIAYKDYNEFLGRHKGRRPRKPKSEMFALDITLLKDYKDKWDTIKTNSTTIETLV
jgi:hypothetical protein